MHDRVISLTAAVEAGLAEVDICDEGGVYRRESPQFINVQSASQKIRTGYERIDGRAPPSGMATFKDVTVMPNGIIAFRTGEILCESVEGLQSRWLPSSIEAPGAKFESAVLVTKVGARNYGHFLIEILPRIIQARDRVTPSEPLLLSGQSRSFAGPMILEAVKRMLPVVYLGAENVAVEKLRWPLRNTFHPLDNSPKAIANIAQLRNRSLGTGRKLFLTRRDAKSRQLVNENELYSILAPLGFEWTFPGRLTFREQINLFSQASVVVAVAGASLTNLVFMRPGSKVVMLSPATMAGFFFWDLCHHRSIDFHAVFGENTSSDQVDKSADFSVSPESMRSVLTGC